MIIALSAGLVALAIYIIDKFNGEVHHLLSQFQITQEQVQQIAVEWNKVDMAFFKKTPTNAENCIMVLEAKGLGKALSDVLDQPKSYVQSLKLTNVKHILTTDGENLFVYEKSGNGWISNPTGYLNVRTLQKQYVVPKNTSLVDTLVSLQPSAV